MLGSAPPASARARARMAAAHRLAHLKALLGEPQQRIRRADGTHRLRGRARTQALDLWHRARAAELVRHRRRPRARRAALALTLGDGNLDARDLGELGAKLVNCGVARLLPDAASKLARVPLPTQHEKRVRERPPATNEIGHAPPKDRQAPSRSDALRPRLLHACGVEITSVLRAQTLSGPKTRVGLKANFARSAYTLRARRQLRRRAHKGDCGVVCSRRLHGHPGREIGGRPLQGQRHFAADRTAGRDYAPRRGNLHAAACGKGHPVRIFAPADRSAGAARSTRAPRCSTGAGRREIRAPTRNLHGTVRGRRGRLGKSGTRPLKSQLSYFSCLDLERPAGRRGGLGHPVVAAARRRRARDFARRGDRAELLVEASWAVAGHRTAGA